MIVEIYVYTKEGTKIYGAKDLDSCRDLPAGSRARVDGIDYRWNGELWSLEERWTLGNVGVYDGMYKIHNLSTKFGMAPVSDYAIYSAAKN